MAVERKLIQENKRRLLMREFLAREAARAGFGGCEITRTPLGLRIRLVAERPGFVIGRRGSTIQRITRELAEKFDLDNPQIEVEEAGDPNLNPQIMAQKMAEALERGWHFRRAGHSTVRRIMGSGAKGCQIILTGKLTGSRGRMEKFTAGHIKHCGEPALQFMEQGYAMAKKKLGTIGVKVAIMDQHARLPDEVNVLATAKRTERAVEIADEAAEGEEAEAAHEEIEKAVSEDKPAEAEPEPSKITEEQIEADIAEAEEVEAEVEAAATAGGSGGAKLTDIPGVGKAKADALEGMGFDYQAVLEASADELAEVSGIGPKLSKKIKRAVQELEEGHE